MSRDQAMFRRIEIDEGKVTDVELAPPFDLLLNPQAVAHYGRRAPARRTVESLSEALRAEEAETNQTGTVWSVPV